MRGMVARGMVPRGGVLNLLGAKTNGTEPCREKN